MTRSKRKGATTKIFVAGASGAIGGRLVPRLVGAGHDVVATMRSPKRAEEVRRLGAEPVVVDGLDADAVAEALGAKPPRHVPAWLGRLAAGEVAVSMMTRIRGSSNEKAKRELGWRPRYESYRDGFRADLERESAPRPRLRAA